MCMFTAGTMDDVDLDGVCRHFAAVVAPAASERGRGTHIAEIFMQVLGGKLDEQFCVRHGSLQGLLYNKLGNKLHSHF